MGVADRSNNSEGGSRVSIHPMALVKALRPQQWIKNGLVFLPFVFSVNVAWSPSNFDPVSDMLVKLALLAAGFCALSSATYLLNDMMDRHRDREHPVKRNRPIASGQVGIVTALTLMTALAVGGLAVMAAVDLMLGAIGVLYLAINVSYSLGLKQVVLIDLMLVASGYVIRTAAGAVAIDVAASPWLYVTTAAGALFIVLGRRYAEVRLAGDAAAQQRPVLGKYGNLFINQLLMISATSAWLSYTLYTVEASNLPDNNTMLLLLPVVTFGLFRYLYLLNTSQQAEAPEQLIVCDLPLIFSIFCWIVGSGLVLWIWG
ncbi:MAG TPA: decaprenyl-phosphate phosphoribosyltransferase [Dehalococcoidia bacterium]|nr:decaprenyl-phosphate phosphoribosyltransferase [Dehalococcoidia bacterium]